MTTRATGTFHVTLDPQASVAAEEPTIGRLRIDKQFHGDLRATSKGQMLSYRTAIDNSAGYVALERVEGTLGGRSGTFALQHYGVMDRGGGDLMISVVPDSGTDGLVGLKGKMNIVIVDGAHTYEFDYTFVEDK